MSKSPLIRSFTIFSLLAFIITGVILSSITSQHIRNDKVFNLYEVSRMAIDTTFPDLDFDIDSNDMLAVEIKEVIDTKIRNHLIAYDVHSISVFNNQKKIIMTDDQTFLEISKISYIYDQLFVERKNFIKSNTFNSNDPSQPNAMSFDLYIPITTNSNSNGVVVIRFSDSIITTHANELVLLIVITMVGGLIILFALLIGIMYKTSQTLLKQNDALKLKNEELESANKTIDKAYVNTVIAISNAVDARDPYTAGHSSRVSTISLAIAKVINLSEDDIKTLEYATLFHDIGKIGISDAILNKAGKLNDEEYAQMKKHPEIGINILSGIEFLEKSLSIIKHHHERFDGRGYPDGLVGDEIPLGSRIVAIADTFDAMTTDRPYRKGVSSSVAISEIIKNSGSQFDGSLVDSFLKIDLIEVLNRS
ncbi:MAG: hypothetical protein FD133_1832 [Erysipelotrichaceae bacterium]|nr:MAG: hypothetical protein FD179_1493 [Erysipelotrichaceae bacterium]TXT16400.1 MAG: hypothetical protein FD133_1832 [Erysipelotrichaceae bacterium]